MRQNFVEDLLQKTLNHNLELNFLVSKLLSVCLIVVCGTFRDGARLEEELPPQHAHARRWQIVAAPKKQKTDVGADVLLRVARCAGNDCNFFFSWFTKEPEIVLVDGDG